MARTIPSSTYASPGDLVTAQIWNNGTYTLNNWLSNRPMFRGRGQLNQSIANNTWTAVQYALNMVDTDGGHNTVVNNSEYVAQVDGWYWVKGCVAWNPSGVSNVACRIDTAIAVNGAIIVGSAQFVDKGNQVNSSQSASAIVFMYQGDYVELWTRQGTGASQSLDNNAFGSESDLNVLWIYT